MSGRIIINKLFKKAKLFEFTIINIVIIFIGIFCLEI